MPGYQLSASGQHLPSTQAAAPIVRSWERCASAAADLHDDPVALRHGDLQERLEQHACVLRAASPKSKPWPAWWPAPPAWCCWPTPAA
ncbi:sigma-54-dependent transcriptional regulator [Bordetella pertussis]|nr:sigma-54-dependent transcriptional regulator [Bordetella pertussis]